MIEMPCCSCEAVICKPCKSLSPQRLVTPTRMTLATVDEAPSGKAENKVSGLLDIVRPCQEVQVRYLLRMWSEEVHVRSVSRMGSDRALWMCCQHAKRASFVFAWNQLMCKVTFCRRKGQTHGRTTWTRWPNTEPTNALKMRPATRSWNSGATPFWCYCGGSRERFGWRSIGVRFSVSSLKAGADVVKLDFAFHHFTVSSQMLGTLW